MYDDDVAFIVEGRLISPYEQIEFDRLYEAGLKEKFATIDEVEKTLITSIDEDALLMSLKLSHDKERLFAYIKNTQLENSLFLKLIKLYDWCGEGFFENDSNRDVTAALITRFYFNIERNHNVQYATLGLMHLVSQTYDADLIETISSLEPIKKGFQDTSLQPILMVISKNGYTPDSVLNTLIKKGDLQIKASVASRDRLALNLQKALFSFHEEEIDLALCKNSDLNAEIAKNLIPNRLYAVIIAQNIKLDDEIFELFFHAYPSALAKNFSLTKEMQTALLSLNRFEVTQNLATNINLDQNVCESIMLLGDESINLLLFSNKKVSAQSLREAYMYKKNHLSLALNEATPTDILVQLSKASDFEVLKALSANPSTPVGVLYELRLDQRLERIIAKNSSFTDHIKTENIGWQD